MHTIGCARPLAYYLAAMVVLIEAGGFYSRIYGKIINRTPILQHDILLYIDPSLLPAAKPFAGHRAGCSAVPGRICSWGAGAWRLSALGNCIVAISM